MKRNPKHFIPNIITLTNMLLGFLAIALITNGEPLNAGVAVLIAGMLDVFDGKLARLLGIESRFGMEFDSMADTISFCVVPSVLVYSLYVDGLNPLLGLLISFLPIMFGTIRLAKYNISKEIVGKNNYSEGLTTPIAAITLFSYLFFNHQVDGDFGDPRTALMLVTIVSILMVSPIHFAKFPLLSFKSGSKNSILLLIFIISVIGIICFKGLFLFPVSLLFIGWNIINWLLKSSKNSYKSNLDH
tara:strand:- start:108 stop:839 length:732 start_codon:yes stop_codon:yes gene_type:complete